MLRDVASDQQNEGLQARVVIDRATAARLGITPPMIDDALYDAFGQRQISTMFTQLNQYRVVLEADPAFQRSPEDLQHIYLPVGAGGRRRSAERFTRVETTTAPLSINHQGQFPVVTFSFNLAPGASLGSAVDGGRAVKQRARLPASIRDRIPGHGAGLSGGARQRAAAHPRRAHHRLHRPRRAL